MPSLLELNHQAPLGRVWGVGCRGWGEKKLAPTTNGFEALFFKTIALVGVASPFQRLPHTPHPTPYPQREALDQVEVYVLEAD